VPKFGRSVIRSAMCNFGVCNGGDTYKVINRETTFFLLRSFFVEDHTNRTGMTRATVTKPSSKARPSRSDGVTFALMMLCKVMSTATVEGVKIQVEDRSLCEREYEGYKPGYRRMPADGGRHTRLSYGSTNQVRRRHMMYCVWSY
jgi:hypothetical protein